MSSSNSIEYIPLTSGLPSLSKRLLRLEYCISPHLRRPPAGRSSLRVRPNKREGPRAGPGGGGRRVKKAITITYNSRDSLLVTHATTSRPIHGLNIGERTGTVIFHDLWS